MKHVIVGSEWKMALTKPWHETKRISIWPKYRNVLFLMYLRAVVEDIRCDVYFLMQINWKEKKEKIKNRSERLRPISCKMRATTSSLTFLQVLIEMFQTARINYRHATRWCCPRRISRQHSSVEDPPAYLWIFLQYGEQCRELVSL